MATLLALCAPAVACPAEVARVRAHLAGALDELRAADVSSLTPAQRVRRAAVIEELARYRERGEFPRNLDFAEATPYFIDDRGVRCAMAHLIESSGGGALVRRVAATANNARVKDLASDAELRAWLADHGMTVAEAARVQPAYPREVGGFCSNFDDCLEGTCEPAPDGAEVAYCTIPCDPAQPGVCPVGVDDTPMECLDVSGTYQCAYPGQTPGTPGWPCTTTDWFCLGASVRLTDTDSESGTCARECLDDDRCEDGDVCRTWEPDPVREVCQPPIAAADGGCSAATNGRGTLAAMLLAVLALITASAARRRAPRCTASGSRRRRAASRRRRDR